MLSVLSCVGVILCKQMNNQTRGPKMIKSQHLINPETNFHGIILFVIVPRSLIIRNEGDQEITIGSSTENLEVDLHLIIKESIKLRR
jgi:hypothetical protein